MSEKEATVDYRITQRLTNMLGRDKLQDPQHVCEVLCEEVKPLISAYLDIESDIKVRFKKDGEKNVFWIEFTANRIKPFGYIPF